MNPYQAPKARVGSELPDSQAWLAPHLRRAFIWPPLVAAPVAGVVIFLLGEVDARTALPGWMAITVLAYLGQFTYGALCYLVLNQIRRLRLWWLLAASQLPFVIAVPGSDLRTVAVYSIAALAVALASAYFLLWQRR